MKQVFWIALVIILALTMPTTDFAQTGSPVILAANDFVLSDAQAAAGIDGRLKISLKVNKKGLVEDVDIIAGPIYPCKAKPREMLEEFKSHAKKNARTFRFEPPTKHGKPTTSTIVLTLTVGEAYKRSVKEGVAKKLAEDGLLDDRSVDAGIVNGRAISLPKPKWPLGLVVYSLPHLVSVDIIVDKDGSVLSAGTLSGQKEFQEVARDAACSARFSPTFLGSVPVKVTGMITYNFVR